MKALNEIGIKKAMSYFFQSLLLVFYNLLLFSPLRAIFLISMGSNVKSGTTIMGVKFINFYHKGFPGLKIGRDCFLGDEVLIDLYDEVEIENQVTIAQRVTLLTHINVGYKDHPLQKYFPKKSQPIKINSGSFIGAGSIILPGVTIGEESFVAAGSVVTEDVPNNTLVAGVPAKPVRKIK